MATEEVKATEMAKDAREGKYLTFTLDKEEYGIGITKVKEIIGMIAYYPRPPDPALCEGGN